MSQSMENHGIGQTGATIRPTPKDDLIDASQLIGRKWQTVIVYRLLQDGPMGFSELQQTIESVSSKVLSDNLAELEDEGLLSRELVQTRPLRVEYSLTAAGKALEPVLSAILDWRDDYRAAVQEAEDA